MKQLIVLSLITLSLTGCVVGKYDGTKQTFTYGALFHKGATSGLKVSSADGLALGRTTGSGDPETINALADLIGKSAAAAAKAAAK